MNDFILVIDYLFNVLGNAWALIVDNWILRFSFFLLMVSIVINLFKNIVFNGGNKK